MEARGAVHLLTVDEGIRPRANSDPTVTTGSLLLPEIKVEDCTDSDLPHSLSIHSSASPPFGLTDPPRPRSNTCPEDLFRKHHERPPTPPPGTFRKGRKFKSGFAKPVLKESVSFTHHRLTKLTESEDAEDPHAVFPAVGEWVKGADTELLRSQLNKMEMGHENQEPLKMDSARLARNCPEDCATPLEPTARGKAENSQHQNCDGGTPETSKKKGSVSDKDTEEPFLSQSSVQRRCAQSNATSLDNKQLQAC